MKFATYKNGSRDGQLMLVSRDLTRTVAVQDIALTLQHALDNWAQVAGALIRQCHRMRQEFSAGVT